MKKTKQAEVVQDTVQSVIVGGDADEHGCKASAGYTWSVIKTIVLEFGRQAFNSNPLKISHLMQQ